MNVYLGIAALVIVVLFGLTLHFYGNARYEAGAASVRASQATAGQAAATEAAKDLERKEHETNTMDDDAVDADLRALGIMRNPADR